MKKVICGLVLLVSLVLSGCSNSENHSKTDEYKYDKATFESKYDLIFLSFLILILNMSALRIRLTLFANRQTVTRIKIMI